jgi:hypothetical protein
MDVVDELLDLVGQLRAVVARFQGCGILIQLGCRLVSVARCR